MSRKRLQEMISDPSSHRIASTNLLGRIYWSLFDKLDISYPSFIASMRKYVEDPAVVPEQTAAKRSEKTSNLTAEMSAEHRLSWSKFLEAFKAIEIVKLRITVEVWRGRREHYAITVLETDLRDIDDTAETEAKSKEDEVT